MANERVTDVLAAMERVVSAATPGPWEDNVTSIDQHWSVKNGSAVIEMDGSASWNGCTHRLLMKEADRTYVARFDPPTLTALLAVVRAAQAMREKMKVVRLPMRVAADVSMAIFTETAELDDALDALTRPPQGAGG